MRPDPTGDGTRWLSRFLTPWSPLRPLSATQLLDRSLGLRCNLPMHCFDHFIDTCFGQTQHAYLPADPSQSLLSAVKAAGKDILCTASVGTALGSGSEGGIETVTWEGVVENPHDLIEGLKVGWTHPPQDVKVSLNIKGSEWSDATNWFPAPRPDAGDNNFVVQNIVLRHPVKAKGIRLHMRDARKQGMFGIKQIALVGHTLLS